MRKSKGKNGKAITAVLLIAVSLFCVCAFVKANNSPVEPPNPAMRLAQGFTDPINAQGSAVPVRVQGSMVPIRVSDINNTHFLELVNLKYAIKSDPDNSQIVSAWPAIPVSSIGASINKTALGAASRMFAAARKANAGSYYLSSGYRNYDEQKQTYDEEADKSYAQPPGHSEHETGLAMDIMAAGVTQNALAASKQGQWLADNSWQFGFILRYQQGKQNITGISYEPWHFRYIGQPHAYYCYKNNLCLEEYIQFLKDKGGYEITLDGKKYSVFYEKPQNGIINVPGGLSYEVSDDNTGGYIITAWGG